MGGNVPAVVHHGQKFETQAELAVTLFGPGIQDLSLVDHEVQHLRDFAADPILSKQLDPAFKIKSKWVDLTGLVRFSMDRVKLFCYETRNGNHWYDEDVESLRSDVEKLATTLSFNVAKIKDKVKKLKLSGNMEPMLSILGDRVDREEHETLEIMRKTRKALLSHIKYYYKNGTD